MGRPLAAGSLQIAASPLSADRSVILAEKDSFDGLAMPGFSSLRLNKRQRHASPPPQDLAAWGPVCQRR